MYSYRVFTPFTEAITSVHSVTYLLKQLTGTMIGMTRNSAAPFQQKAPGSHLEKRSKQNHFSTR